MPTLIARVRRIERTLNLSVSAASTPAVIRKLKRLRRDRGLSLRTVAAEVGCSAPFLHDLERDRRSMSWEFEKKLTAALQRLEAKP